ncbi:septum site-determining protein Ssd [[Mycobacterium] crassicus]|uniref:Septum site-determining protein Ssd n=1 Tax=[Mycobacterium] crassicus TaxID=2872309 RepID=A0ABU5XJ05_9MYCO|nr:septum site-determining protein Ssd [Mycolicibacter sp. MYC098]MEB3022219.1 septum site-determining protein Ssd [Mycolicibacter sp. MYC098]
MSTTGLLALVTQPALRDELDRVGAAAGVRVIHLGVTVPSRKAWAAAAAVVLDEAAAARCSPARLPRRAHVIVLTDAQPTPAGWQAAVAVGAQRVLTLPADGNELVAELAEAAEGVRDGARRGEAVAVIGARGGAGASLLATALAQNAGDALLIDLDIWGGGIDLLAGTENVAGLRWGDLTRQSGRLTWPALRAALPRHRGVSVLSGPRNGDQAHEIEAGAVDAVVDAGRRGGITVICDLPRALTDPVETALSAADLVVMVSPCDVRACSAGAALAPRLRATNPNVGLVVRGPAPGGLRAAEVAEIIGLPLLATLRAETRLIEQLEHAGLRLPRRSALAAAAARVLQVLPGRKAPAA